MLGALISTISRLFLFSLSVSVLQFSKSGVASSWYHQIWDVCGNTFFYMLKVSQLLEFYRTGHWKFKMRCPCPLWVWIRLNCIFGLFDTKEVDFKGKKTEKWLGLPWNWSLKIQNGMPPPPLPLSKNCGLNCIFSLWDTLEVDFKGKDWKMAFKLS